MTAENRCEEVLVALRRIVRAIDLHSRQLIQKHGITGPQALILRKLQKLEQAPVGELARSVNLSQATVTDILDRLEGRGLVQRTRSTLDKRRVLVRLTGGAVAVLRDSPPLLQESFASEFGRLQEWEQTLLLSSLQRVAAMMDARDLPAVPVLSTEALELEPDAPDDPP